MKPRRGGFAQRSAFGLLKPDSSVRLSPKSLPPFHSAGSEIDKWRAEQIHSASIRLDDGPVLQQLRLEGWILRFVIARLKGKPLQNRPQSFTEPLRLELASEPGEVRPLGLADDADQLFLPVQLQWPNYHLYLTV